MWYLYQTIEFKVLQWSLNWLALQFFVFLFWYLCKSISDQSNTNWQFHHKKVVQLREKNEQSIKMDPNIEVECEVLTLITI